MSKLLLLTAERHPSEYSALGEGECDPSTPTACSLRKTLALDEVRGYSYVFTSLMTMILGSTRSMKSAVVHLSILGAIYTDKPTVQQLTEVWVGAATVHRNVQVHHLARVFGSSRLV